MLLIKCPFCGERAQTEFTYGGDATIERPSLVGTSREEWLDHIYLRDNPRGTHKEWWQHSSGCRQWITVKRDTLTHEMLKSASKETTSPSDSDV